MCPGRGLVSGCNGKGEQMSISCECCSDNSKEMNETTWKKEPETEGKHGGCLNCEPRPSFFQPDWVIGVGFGYAGLHRDGEPVWTEPNEPESDDEYMTGAKAEELAAADPDHDWRIVMDGPLSGRTYQRHAAGEWALIEQNQGFA